MILQICFVEKEFQAVLYRTRTFIMTDCIANDEILSFSVYPKWNEDDEEDDKIVGYQGILFYEKVKNRNEQ